MVICNIQISKYIFYNHLLQTSIQSILEHIVQDNEETTGRIVANLTDYAIINNVQELPVHSTFEGTTTTQLIKNVAGVLVFSANSAVRDLDPTNMLKFLRIQTKKYELLVAPEKEFTIICQQN